MQKERQTDRLCECLKKSETWNYTNLPTSSETKDYASLYGFTYTRTYLCISHVYLCSCTELISLISFLVSLLFDLIMNLILVLRYSLG